MFRFAVLGAALASACGAMDDRPATLEFITETILAPSCATAVCHSAFTRQLGDAFDTPASTRFSIATNQLVNYPDDVADPSGSYLVKLMTVGVQSIQGSYMIRMPFDAAMPDADIELIKTWIAAGVHGAQCQPNAQGLACQAKRVELPTRHTEYSQVECVNGDVGATVQLCVPNACNFRTGTCGG